MLLLFIDDRDAGVTLWAPIAVTLPGCDPVQPDLLVLPGAGRELFRDGRIVGTPALVIEVLGANVALEATVKRRAYANAEVPEYWIVRLAQRDVLRCTAPDPALGDFAQGDHVAPDGTLVSPLLPLPVPVAPLFAGAPDRRCRAGRSDVAGGGLQHDHAARRRERRLRWAGHGVGAARRDRVGHGVTFIFN